MSTKLTIRIVCVLQLRRQVVRQRADRSRRLKALREQLSVLEDTESKAKHEVRIDDPVM